MTDTSGIAHQRGRGCCGPASLSACLSILGLEAEPRELARIASGSWDTCVRLLDQERPSAVPSLLGISTEFLVRDRAGGAEFARGLREHLQRRGTALVLTSNFGRWVAAAGWLADEETYVVVDSSNGSRAFSVWTERRLLEETWNEDAAGDEPDSYFAILVRREDGEPARCRLTREFLDLCEKISEDGAVGMACDLGELIRRASPREESRQARVPLSKLLETIEPEVLEAVERCERSPEVGTDELRRLCRAYRVVADAAGLQVSRGLEPALLAQQMISLLAGQARTGAH